MQFDDLTYHRVQQVRHQGRLVTVAEASEPEADEHRLWFHILDLTPPTASETDEEGAAEKAPAGPDLPPADTFLPLRYPDQVRLVGMEVVTTDAQDAGVTAATLGNWAVVSDGEMLYLFRSLSELAKGSASRGAPARGYVYANRFAVVDVPVTGDDGDGDGTSEPVLRAKIESRYRHSGMRDTPLDPDDSAGYRDMDGEVFSEPTMLFGMLAPADDLFTVALTPSDIAGVMRWQFLCATADGELASYSYLRDTNGWPDLTGEARRLDTGSSNLRPDAVMTLEEETTGATLVLAGQPASLLYRRQEQAAAAPADDPGQDAPGDVGSAVTGPRLMLASLVVERGSPDGPARLMVVELATDGAGQPVLPGTLRVPNVAETREAFDVRRLADAGVDELDADLGLLEFPDIADVTFTDPMLLEAADGRIHLYTSGTTGTGSDAVSELLAFQYDTASSRARFIGRWVDPSGKEKQEGRLLAAARQVGPDGNDLSVQVEHGASPGFCTVKVAREGVVTESWPGVPRELTQFLAVLSGEASDDPLDPLVADGTIPFYDYLGRRPTVRIPDPERTLVVTSALVAGQPSPLPLVAVSSTPDGDSGTLTLEFEAASAPGVTRGWPISLEFANVPESFDDAASVLAGTRPGYHYSPGQGSDVSFSGQVQRIRSGRGAVDVVSVQGTPLQIRIDDDPSSRRLCRVQIRLDKREVQFQKVPRDPDRWIRVLNLVDPDYDYDADTTAGTKDAAAHFVVVGTNMEQRITNQTWQDPDPSSWPNLSALYGVLVDPVGGGPVGDGEVTYPVGPAQGPTGVTGDPSQGSALIRAVALDRPTTGRPALVGDGAFKQDQRGGFGGWLRERPVAATFPTGTVGSAPWDQQRSRPLACRNDLTLEAWVRPKAPVNDTDRPRILTVNGDTAEARYGLGLAAPPPNALRIGNGNRMHQDASGATPPSWTALWQFDPTASPSETVVFDLRGPITPFTNWLVQVLLWGTEAGWHWKLRVGPLGVNWIYQVTDDIVLSGWSQHAVRLDSETKVLSYWVGGKPVHQSDPYANFQYLARPVALGYGAPAGLGFDVGTIASPRFYGEALSDARIVEIARYGAPLDDSGLLGAWEFERHDGLNVPNLSGARPDWLGTIEPDPNPDWGPVPGPEAVGASRVFAAVGNRVVYGNEPVLPPDQWSHVAAVSTGSHALRFDGSQHAVVAEAEGLEPGDGFSIDTVLTWDGPKADGSPSVVFAKATARPSDPLNRLPSSYRLGIEPDGRAYLDLFYLVKDGSKVKEETSRRFWGPTLTAGEAYSLAVACRVDTTGGSGEITSTISVLWHWYGPDGTLYLDPHATPDPLTGQVVLTESTDVAASIASPTAIDDSSAYGYFAGTIGLLRFWGRVLTDDEVQALLPAMSVPEGMDEPAAEWACNEGRGKLLRDSIAGADATLSSERVWITSRLTAVLDLYVDGKPAFTTTNSVARRLNGGFGPSETIEVGGLSDAQSAVSSARAEIAEVRVWDRARTRDQIDAERWTRLRDRTEGLVGYWRLSAGRGTTFADSQGNDLTAIGYGSIEPPGNSPWVASTAPLADDGPQVRNPLGGAKTPWLIASASTPSAAEYGALGLDAAGEVTGTMERMYTYVDGTGALAITTGFGVGELDVQYVGQAQSPPTLVGYVEGPPPVPGENLTRPFSETSAGYAGCSAVELTGAESTTYAYTTQMDAGPDIKAKLDIGNLLGTQIQAGFGFQVQNMNVMGKIGFASTIDTVIGIVQSAQLGVGTTQRRTNRLSLVGAFEPKGEVDGALGRRFIPENLGYALVRSMAVNVFAMRLRRTGTLVGLSTLPDPDIPEDWNLIMFPIEPTYTKLGTLDGRLGLGNDPDFPTADRERGSYFRPEEAYNLVAQVEANTADIVASYANFNPHKEFGGASLPQVDVGYDWQNDRPNRDLVDTYVWTASGGLFAEQQQTTSKRHDTTAGNFTVTAMVGLLWENKFNIGGVGGFWDGNALVGAHVKGTESKTRTDQRDFAISAKVDPEGDLRSYDAEKGTWSSGPTPGKVDAYRFKTFYLAPKPAHFETFFDEVVDQNWYQNSQEPAAVALRQARSSRGGVWRVLHRTTYVSRIPPTFDTAPTEDASRPSLAVINTEANWWVLALVDAALRRTPGPTLAERIGTAAEAVLRTDLAAAVTWWQALLDAAASNPTSRAAEEYATLSSAMYTYVLGYYRSNPGLVPDPGS